LTSEKIEKTIFFCIIDENNAQNSDNTAPDSVENTEINDDQLNDDNFIDAMENDG
jgi:hypothetical protein